MRNSLTPAADTNGLGPQWLGGHGSDTLRGQPLSWIAWAGYGMQAITFSPSRAGDQLGTTRHAPGRTIGTWADQLLSHLDQADPRNA